MSRPDIAVVGLGGTIASVRSDGCSGATPILSCAQIVASIPQLDAVGNITTFDLGQQPSADLGFRDVTDLATFAEQRIAGGFTGVVVLQGTDTLEETAFLLDVLTDADAPVVFTGAMRHPDLPGADGAANILAAARVASSGQAKGLGPLVVINDEVHLARFIRKNHTAKLSSFGSPSLGPIGWVIEDRVSIPLIPRDRMKRIVVPGLAEEEVPKVAIVKLGLGSDSDFIDYAVRAGYDGIVVEVMGGGHVPSGVIPGLTAAASRVPVVVATRANAGDLYRETYDFAGSEAALRRAGSISGGILDGCKARLALMALLAAGADHEEMQAYFES